MKTKSKLALFGMISAVFSSGCTMITRDTPTCRRVSAEEFMGPHTFKGIPTDQFIGMTFTGHPRSKERKPDKAFKEIWEFYAGWGIIWCPAAELPADYLRTAKQQPIRTASLQSR